MNLTKVSKFISLILRHKPEEIGIELDKYGWAKVDELVAGIAKRYPDFTKKTLTDIVRTDEKQRYSFNEDRTLIRANQGHSIPVDLELPIVKPPEHLYHGTGKKYVDSIWKNGLIPKSRLYVHLSGDCETAEDVGRRHGEPVIFTVDAGTMSRLGYVFYQSKNGVWLTEKVPAQFLLEAFEYVSYTATEE